MNILKKANEIAALLKQASDIEVEAKKKAKKEEPVEDLDLDAIPTPDLSDKSLDDLAAPATEADAPAAGSAFTQLKDALLNATTPTAAVAQCKDAILGEINNDPELFDQQIKDLLMLVAKDPELKATDSASLQAALESIKPKKESKEEAPAAAESPLPEDPTAAPAATDDDLANAAGDLPGSDVPAAPKEEENAVDELASMPTASLFDALKKTAFDVNELAGVPTEPTLEAKGLSDDEKAAFDNWASSYLTLGSTVDADSIVSNYLNENHLPNTPEDRAPYIEYFNQNKTGSAHSTLLTKQEALDAFLKEAREYQAPEDPMDNVIKQAKAAASAEDFLQKIATAESILKTANTLDEKANSPQHPGKKLFNGDVVSYTDGKQQYFPGQKVMQTRDGGNATVVSVFNFKGKPDVDVYNNKPARKNVTSINTKDGGTIAFFQPMHEEPTDITVPTDYTGVVTGEVQKKPEIKEQLAGAGHKVNDFMDEKFKLADKKKVAGDLPQAKASFEFKGLAKKATPSDMMADSNTTTTGTSALGTDAACGPKDTNLKQRPKTLTPEEVVKAKADFEEKEGQVINTAASLEANAAPAAAPEAPQAPEAGKDTPAPKEAADKPLNDPNTVDAAQLSNVEAAIKALPEDKQAQLKEVADSPTLFKQKLEEVWVMTNPGEPKPTLNDEGYKQVAKNLFNVEPQQNTLATPAKPSTDTKKSEKAPDGAKEAGKGAEAQDLDGLFKDLGL